MRFPHNPFNPFKRRLARTGRGPALVAGLLVIGFALSQFPQVAQWFEPSANDSENAVAEPELRFIGVAHVIDGDTVDLEDGRRVRLIGIDTPEMGYSPRARVEGEDDPFAVEATEHLRRLAEGELVTLKFGPEPEDKYGRTLAYLHLDDGTDLNAELLRAGLARAYRRFDHPRLSRYIQLEEEARAKSLGLWAEN